MSNELPKAIKMACIIFVGAVEDRNDRRRLREVDWVSGFHDGRLSAAKFILRYSLHSTIKRAAGGFIRKQFVESRRNPFYPTGEAT